MRVAIVVVIALMVSSCTRSVTQYNCQVCDQDGCDYTVPDVDITEPEAMEIARLLHCAKHPTADSLEACAKKELPKNSAAKCEPFTIDRDRFFTKTVDVTWCAVCLNGTTKHCAAVTQEYGDDSFAKDAAVKELCGEDSACLAKKASEFDSVCRVMKRVSVGTRIVTH